MPTITVDVESTQQTVTRHVAIGVVYDVAHSLGIPYNIRVIYPGSTDSEDLPITVADDGRNSVYDPPTKVLVQVEEEYLDTDVATMIMRPNNNHPIFYDPNLDIRITPVYARTSMTINFQWRLPDKNMAEKVRNDIRRHATLFRDGLVHEINYRYIIPKVEMVILSELYRKREGQAGYDETMKEWFDQCFSENATVLSNQNASHLTMAMSEIQTNVLGEYDFEVVPEKAEPGTSKSTHVLTFAYTLKYDKILSATMKYPILVHNQPISSKMYDRSVPFELGERLQMPSRTQAYLDHWTNNQYVTGFPMGAPIPLFNEWLPPTTVNGVEGLLRVMIVVNPDDPYELFNFHELGKLKVRDQMLEYMKREGDAVLQHRNSAIHVAIYEDDRMLGSEKLSIDGDLTLRTTFAMDLRKQYNVFVSLLADLKLTKPAASERLRSDGGLLKEILVGIEPTLTERELPKTMTGGYVSKEEYKRVVQNLATKRVPIQGDMRYGHFTVGRFIITV